MRRLLLTTFFAVLNLLPAQGAEVPPRQVTVGLSGGERVQGLLTREKGLYVVTTGRTVRRIPAKDVRWVEWLDDRSGTSEVLTEGSRSDFFPYQRITTLNPPAGWGEVVRLSGLDAERSTPFRLAGGPTRLVFNIRGGEALSCVVSVVPANGLSDRTLWAEYPIEAAGMGAMTIIRPAGVYVLDVRAANCTWDVGIHEGR